MPRYKPSDPLVSKSIRLPQSIIKRLEVQINRGLFSTQTEFIQHCLVTVLKRLEDNQQGDETEQV
jgi:Arc/MetJ-type ribon-helix-helix transcriptional regulator